MAFDEIILPLAKEFKPQIIIRNGGSDPHFNDGLTYLGMTIAGFRMMGDKVREMAEICQGKQIDLMASGYNKVDSALCLAIASKRDCRFSDYGGRTGTGSSAIPAGPGATGNRKGAGRGQKIPSRLIGNVSDSN